jgi:hypothetical protein
MAGGENRIETAGRDILYRNGGQQVGVGQRPTRAPQRKFRYHFEKMTLKLVHLK